MLVDAVDTLVRKHLHMATREARRWAHVPIEQDELAAEGRVGLVRAAQRFDEGRGVPFQAFALLFVRGAILDTVRHRARRNTDRNGGFFDEVSLDELREDGRTPVREAPDLGPSPHEMVEHLDRLKLLHGLPPRERYVLLRTQVDGATAEEVGDELGVGLATVYKLGAHGALRLKRRAA